MKRVGLAVLTLMAAVAAQAQAAGLNSFRDDLYTNANRQILESRDNGAWIRYAWDYQETVVGRDAVTGEVAKSERVDPETANARKSFTPTFQSPTEGAETLDAYAIGTEKKAKFAVIFLHGSQGTKDIGASDVNFGGDFNHIQSLALHSDGFYVSPTLTFDVRGVDTLARLILQIREQAPKAKIILACGSAGAYFCWSEAESPGVSSELGGLILQSGSSFDAQFASTEAAKNRMPILIAHGTKDPLVPVSYAEQAYEQLKMIGGGGYPVRLQLFEGGKHGTPLRMLDWTEAVRWMLSLN